MSTQKSVWTIKAWAREGECSEGWIYKRWRQGLGPRFARDGRKTTILKSPHEYYSRLEVRPAPPDPPIDA